MTGPTNSSPPKTLFAARLRLAQRDAEISNRELAYAMDISESLLAKWKRGDSHPQFENAARLAQILDKSLDYFTAPIDEPAAA